MKTHGVTYAEFEEQTGVCGATLQRIFAGSCRYIESLLSALHFCGLELGAFLVFQPEDENLT